VPKLRDRGVTVADASQTVGDHRVVDDEHLRTFHRRFFLA